MSGYQLDRRLGGLHNQSGRCGRKENDLTPVGNQTPAVQLAAHRYTYLSVPAPILHVALFILFVAYLTVIRATNSTASNVLMIVLN